MLFLPAGQKLLKGQDMSLLVLLPWNLMWWYLRWEFSGWRAWDRQSCAHGILNFIIFKSIIGLQCCVSLWYMGKWFHYIYIPFYVYTYTLYIYIPYVCMCACTHTHTHTHTHRLPQWLSGKQSTYNTGDKGDTGSIPGLGRSPRQGNGNPLLYSCLKNPMDRGAWWAIVHGGAKESDKT